MASIEEVKAAIMQACQLVESSRGPLQQAIQDNEAAVAALQNATDGTGQQDFSESIAQLLRAIELMNEAQGCIQTGSDGAEQGAARL